MNTHNPGEFASVRAVSGLAREVEALRRAWRPIPKRLDELAALVEGITETAARNGPAPKVVAPSWLNMPTDADAVAALLDELCKWLRAVYLRYPDAAQGLPACWLWHPDVVEELVWLMHTWVAAYADDNASATAAGDWHDRYRPGVVRRIRQSAGTCSLESHTAPKPVSGPPLVEAAEPIVTWWAEARGEAAPVPSAAHLAAVPDEPGWGARR